MKRGMSLFFGRSIVAGALLFGATLAGPVRAQDLAPPAPLGPQGPPQPAQSPTVQTLQQSEKEDSGRNFELVYLKAEGGASYVNMTSFSESQLALKQTESAGGMIGVGAGVRLLIFTFGARARMNALADWQLWQIDGEVGFHVPIGRLDPYFALYGGYAFTGELSNSANATVHGFDAGLSVGGDYYFTSLLSLGLDASGGGLFLQRPPVALPAAFSALPADKQMQIKNDPLYANSGNSAGFQFAGSLHLGIHIGL